MSIRAPAPQAQLVMLPQEGHLAILRLALTSRGKHAEGVFCSGTDRHAAGPAGAHHVPTLTVICSRATPVDTVELLLRMEIAESWGPKVIEARSRLASSRTAFKIREEDLGFRERGFFETPQVPPTLALGVSPIRTQVKQSTCSSSNGHTSSQIWWPRV